MSYRTPFVFWRALLSTFAGALAPLSLAPFDYWYMGAISVALLFSLLHHCTPRAGGWLGWCYGLGFFGTGVSWVFVSIHEYGNASNLLAGAMTALFVAALAILFAIQLWLYTKLFRNLIGFCALWVLFEWLRSWLFTGFPWLYLGYGLIDTPLAIFAPLGGVWLLSLYIALSSTLLVTFCKRFKHPLQAATILMVVSLPWIAVQQKQIPNDWTTPVGEPLKVMAVQANIAQQLKWRPSELQSILQTYVDLSQDSDQVDLLIWPETAIPSFYRTAKVMLSPLTSYLDNNNTALISGIPTLYLDPEAAKGRRYTNSLTLFAGGSGSYDKQRLVPFGEYVPLEHQLRGIIDFFDLPMSEFSLGAPNQPLLQAAGSHIAPFICYEIAYPELVRQQSLHSDLLLTVSNDTWFGHSIAPAQHLQIARMRALENGRWIIRATNNGISALISPDGGISATIPQYEQAVLTGEVQRMQGLTPYQAWGIKPLMSIIGLLLLIGLFIAPRSRLTRKGL
ncbi:apolipoprotein N-acyltransferase [Amphritea sp. 1_MG-2023]|uniref:apolipoprotein N-acyltransferase n=1 Tax=Amphritea sp. 1_MG-2023 TaxID=3062670 RepID=UPI0026E16126|nr:apolipoprotein N-acyltransferase [Amphritea sp. 1_MG-2023]MDO6565044.1 apolipoprotein N-acyltransferase [Amphritea sp. 1_MG-2023]